MRKDIEAKLFENSRLGYDNMIIDYIKQVVCSYYDVDADAMMYKTRKRQFVKCRQICMYLIGKHSKATVSVIGLAFNKDHATVIHSKRVLQDNMDCDKDLKREVQELDKIIEIKAQAIVNNFSIEKNFYYINMNEFVSMKPDRGKTIILVGYSDDEVKAFIEKNDVITGNRKHENKGMYIIEKNENEENKNQDSGILQ